MLGLFLYIYGIVLRLSVILVCVVVVLLSDLDIIAENIEPDCIGIVHEFITNFKL